MRPHTRARPGAPICLAVLALVGSGCASLPPAGDDYAAVTVADVQRDAADGAAEPGTPSPTVRWGGTIASVDNRDDDVTELQIVSRPLDRRGRPRHVDASEGRFVAEVDGFLDPEIVRAGRDITVTGPIDGVRDGRVGESDYRFPVVRVDDYRYWKPAARASVAPPGPYGPYGPYASYGPYGPYGYAPFGVAPWGYRAGYGYYPYDFNTRFWHDFYHDPIRRPLPRRGRVGVGVTVRP